MEDEKLKEVAKFLGEQQKKLIDLIEFDYNFITDVEVDGIDYADRPDFCDAYISSAKYHDLEMSEEMLEKLNEDRDFVYEKLMDYIY